jgi:SAM-dependent methyltransferase
MVRVYDRSMFSGKQRRYYGHSDFYNFGYWATGAATQRDACLALVDRLVSRTPAPGAGRILDVACGMGASTKRLGETWPAGSVTAINVSEAQLERARHNAPGATILRMDATKLDFPDAHFDVVICVEAAFHFDTREAFLREACRVLKPGGTLVLSDILFRRGVAWLGVHLPKANLVSNIDAYRRPMQAAGFTDIEVEDATDACLGGFRRNLANWAQSPDNANQKRFGRKLLLSLGCKVVAAYFGLICRTYLLVAARKPQ